MKAKHTIWEAVCSVSFKLLGNELLVAIGFMISAFLENVIAFGSNW